LSVNGFSRDLFTGTGWGHEAVKVLVTKMKGETVPTVIDSGAAVISMENLDTAEIQALLACFFAVFA